MVPSHAYVIGLLWNETKAHIFIFFAYNRRLHSEKHLCFTVTWSCPYADNLFVVFFSLVLCSFCFLLDVKSEMVTRTDAAAFVHRLADGLVCWWDKGISISTLIPLRSGLRGLTCSSLLVHPQIQSFYFILLKRFFSFTSAGTYLALFSAFTVPTLCLSASTVLTCYLIFWPDLQYRVTGHRLSRAATTPATHNV